MSAGLHPGSERARAADRQADNPPVTAPPDAPLLAQVLFESTTDGLIIATMEGTIVEVNPAASTLYGYEREDLIGRPLAALVRADHPTLLPEVLGKVGRGETFVAEAVDRRRDGTAFDVEIRASSFAYAGAPHLLVVVRDVMDRARWVQLLERRVQERTRELSTLLRVSQDVVSTLQLEPLLAQTLDRLGDVVAYEAAAIFALESEDTLALLDYRGPRPQQSLPRRWDLSTAEHIRMVLDHRQPLVIADVRARTLQAAAWQRSWGAQLGRLAEDSVSWLGVPLMVKDRVIGTLTLEHGEPGHFSPFHAKLALAFANQVAVALENARLYTASQRLGILEERQRIARELHDSVSQALYGIGLAARTAQARLARGEPERAADPIATILSLAEAGLAEMRALIFELRPDSLEEEGLVAALAKTAAGLQARYELQITTRLDQEPVLSLEAKEALYRVAHEALNNTVKHAQASGAEIVLTQAPDVTRLVIRDDGAGFDAGRAYPGHFGLRSMRERVERLGGTLTIESAPGAGTTVHAAVPNS